MTNEIKAAEDRARRALEDGNDVAHRIHMDRADALRSTPSAFDDLDTDPNAPVDRAAQIRADAHIVNGGESLKSYPCPKCGGRGSRTYGYVNIKTYPCNYCQRTGKVTAKREENIARAIKADRTKAQNLGDKVFAWHNANPVESAYLMRRATSSNFFASLRDQLNTRGVLTDGQIEAIRKNIRDDEARRALVKAEAPTVDVSAIDKLFATAKENGLKKLAFRTEHLTIKAAREDLGKAPALYVLHGEEYVGKIVAGKFLANRAAKSDTLDLLNTVAADPLGAAVFYGRQVGKCSCCGRELTDPVSVENGIGPICQTKWGM